MPLGDEDGRLRGGERRAAGAVRWAARRESPADRAARDGKAECAQYVSVSYDARDRPTKPFRARIYFQSKEHHICSAPTAREAARAYGVVARMTPGRKLNFPAVSLAVQSSSQRSTGTSAVPSEIDIHAKIAGIQRGFGPAGAVKYFGVSKSKRIRNPYQAQVRMDGKHKHLGDHPTGEAAARHTTRLSARAAAASSTFPTTAARQQQFASSIRWRRLHLQARLLHEPAPSKPHGKRSPPPHKAGHPTSYHQCVQRAMSRTTEMALLLRSRRRAGASALASHLLRRSALRAQRHLRRLRLCQPCCGSLCSAPAHADQHATFTRASAS
jgi:hypothetical protein